MCSDPWFYNQGLLQISLPAWEVGVVSLRVLST